MLLTALNLLNYIDRSVLFAVQPLVQSEFHLTNTQVGYLTSAFLGFYMIAAPFTGPLADRYSRKLIIILGAVFWSGLRCSPRSRIRTGNCWFATHWSELERRRLSPSRRLLLPTFSGEASAAASLACFIWRSRSALLQAICSEASSVLILDGDFRSTLRRFRASCWRSLCCSFPSRLAANSTRLQETPERASIRGLIRNPAFWMVTLGMAAGTFSLGGIQVWMPTFLSRVRGYSLEAANLMFGKIVVVDGILASLAGGWLGDRLLPRMKGSYYFVSAVSMGLGVPVMIVGIV